MYFYFLELHSCSGSSLTVVKLEDKEMAGRRSETPHIRPSLQSAEFPIWYRGEISTRMHKSVLVS